MDLDLHLASVPGAVPDQAGPSLPAGERGMVVSILLPDMKAGGAERVSIDLAHEFVRHGHSVEFALMNATGEFLAEARAAFPVVDLQARRTRNMPRALAGYFRSRKPDAVIANMWPLTVTAVAGRLLSGTRPRLVLVEHGMLSEQYRSWGALHNLSLLCSIGLFYRGADAVGAVSQGVAEDVARLAGMRARKVHVLPNPMRRLAEPREASLARADRLWGCPAGNRILTVGSLKDQKNHSLLLRAFSLLKSPDARLMIVGSGPNESALRALAAALGIAPRVIFAGFQADPIVFYRTADLFVLSSDNEGLPTVLMEALSCGLRVVSTNCPSGPSEILQGGDFGRLVSVGDAAGLAAAMDQALAEPADAEALKRRAADFAPEIAAGRYLELMRAP